MSTLVFVNTYTHSVTFVTDKMLTSLKRIISWIGLDVGKLTRDWEVLERGIRTWLGTQDLTTMVLEVYQPGSWTLVNRWDFDVDYRYGSGDDGTMWVDTDAIRNAIRKCGFDPAGCEYRIIAVTKPGRSLSPICTLMCGSICSAVFPSIPAMPAWNRCARKRRGF